METKTKTKKTTKKRVKTKVKVPKVKRGKPRKGPKDFPLSHYSYSSFVKFSTNPILFKVQYINGDRFDTTWSISGVIGQAFHKGLEVYYGGFEDEPIEDESDAIEFGLKTAMQFLEDYPEGFIEYTSRIPNKQKALDYLAFAYNEYVKAKPWDSKEELISIEEKLEEYIDVEWKGEKLKLPVKLKGYTDKIVREDGKLKIKDYKTVQRFSDLEKIDGKKILQAVEYYFLTYATYEEKPYSITFEEVKITTNRDGSPQIREYEIVFEENALYFDFYFRFYEDVTRALNGEMVYVPNIDAFFDNEVAIIAYINRLDVDEEKAALMEKHKVDNLTDLLKKEIQSAGNMRKLMKKVEEKFVSAKSLNYEKMANEEKIQTKMLEHGMMLQFDSKVEGATVDLYRYTPSIGLKMSRIRNYVADIEQVLGVSGIRVLAPIPNTSFVGFEIPKKDRTFPELPVSDGFNIAIGEDVLGNARRFDIRQAPHMLVAGASGSGKSVFLSSIVKQLSAISGAEIHLYDPKVVELALHKNDSNVVEYKTDIMAIHDGLKNLIQEMNSRYDQLAKEKVRSAEDHSNMPTKFVIIDEFGDLVMQNHVHTEKKKTGEKYIKGPKAGKEKVEEIKTYVSKDISKYILLLAQKARAAGIHLIISTQRPSVDVITGTIKANFPTKVALRTAKEVDSRVILDTDGAEKLRGKGDMIFASDEGMERLQGYKA